MYANVFKKEEKKEETVAKSDMSSTDIADAKKQSKQGKAKSSWPDMQSTPPKVKATKAEKIQKHAGTIGAALGVTI